MGDRARSAAPGVRLALACALVLLVGCAGMVTAHDGERVTVEHDWWISVDSARSVADKACAQLGRGPSVFVGSVSKNPSIPLGSGVVMSTFRCSSTGTGGT